jgi:hypothetical protein
MLPTLICKDSVAIDPALLLLASVANLRIIRLIQQVAHGRTRGADYG